MWCKQLQLGMYPANDCNGFLVFALIEIANPYIALKTRIKFIGIVQS